MEQQALEKVRDTGGARQAQYAAEYDQAHSLSGYQAKDAGAGCAQGHPHTYFLCALRGDESEYAVEGRSLP
jgi:6-pyruvoyl-tetrahydropterin synthase